MENTFKDLEQQESSATWASDKGSCTEAPDGATGQNPDDQRMGVTPLTGEEHPSSCSQTLENLEGLTGKVGTLDLQLTKNRCGTARKRARRARLAEVPAGASDGGQPRSASGGQQQNQQEPSTSMAPTEQKHQKSTGHAHGPSKRQRSARGTPEGRQTKRPKQTGQLSYTRVAQEGLRVAIVCEGYPRDQISRDNFVDIQRAIGQLVDGLPEEGFTPRLVDSYWSKGAAIMVCQDEPTRDWLAHKVPTMMAWEGSRLKVVGMDAHPTYKRVAAWFPGPVEDTEWPLSRLRRLNRGLDTGNSRVYKSKELPNGVRLVLSIDMLSIAVLEGLH